MSTIPVEIRELRQWILWRLEPGTKGKMTKIPYSARGGKAKSTDASTWVSFEEAEAALEAHVDEFNGLGFVLKKDGGFVGVDFDHCIDAEGTIAPAVLRQVERLDSYTERSQSGKGLKVIVRARRPGERCRKNGVEIYDGKQFFALTGDRVDWLPATINDRQAAVDALYRETFGAEEGKSEQPEPEEHDTGLSDEDVVSFAKKAKNGEKFLELWEGRWEALYESQSEADCGLCRMLAFFTGPAPKRVKDLFLKSALGKREKASRSDYLERTVRKALKGMEEFYGTNGAATAEAAPEKVFLRLEDLVKAKPPRWLVRGFIPENSLCVLYGPPGAGKTFLALDLSLSIAAGVPWLGHAVRPGLTVYAAGEGTGGLLNRVLAWGENPLKRCAETFLVAPAVPRLLDAKDMRRFVDAVKKLPAPPSLITLDTLARGLSGADENDAADVGKAIEALDLIRKETGAAVLTLHHCGKDRERGARGSSALLGGADAMLSLDPTREGVLLLRVEKLKDAEAPKPVYLATEIVSLGVNEEGEPISSLRIRRRTTEENKADLGSKAAAIVDLLRKPQNREEGLTAGEIMTDLDLSKTTFFRVIQTLLEGAVLRRKGRYRLAPESQSPTESHPSPTTPAGEVSQSPTESPYRDSWDCGTPAGTGRRSPTSPTDERDPPAWLFSSPADPPRDPADDSLREPGEDDE